MSQCTKLTVLMQWQNFSESRAGLRVLRNQSAFTAVLTHESAPQKPLVPRERPLRSLTMLLTSFQFSHETDPGPNPTPDCSSWEEVILHMESSVFSTGLVRKDIGKP